MKIRLADFDISVFSSLTDVGQSAVNQIDSLMNSYYKPMQPGAVIAITAKSENAIQKKLWTCRSGTRNADYGRREFQYRIPHQTVYCICCIGSIL